MKNIPIKIAIFITILVSSHLNAQWTRKDDLPASNHNLYGETSIGWAHHIPSFSINGLGYVIDWSEKLPLHNNRTFVYDPVSDTWEYLENADFPEGRQTLAYAIAYDNYGYLSYGDRVDRVQKLWRFNPDIPLWEEMTPCPCIHRGHPAFVAANGKIYLGLGESGQDYRDWWSYDIGTDSWQQEDFFPSHERHHPYHFAIEDKVYVGLGHGWRIFNDLYEFDTNTSSWSEVSSLPAEGRVAGTEFSFNGKGYVLSGDGDDHQSLEEGEFWEYDPASDNWKQLPSHPGIGRWAPGSFVIDGVVHFFGGQYDTGNELEIVLQNGDTIRSSVYFSNDFWSYDLKETISGNDESELSEITFSPNPARSIIQLSPEYHQADIQLYDLSGKPMDIQIVHGAIDVSFLEQGIYFLKITGGSQMGSVVKKLIIQ